MSASYSHLSKSGWLKLLWGLKSFLRGMGSSGPRCWSSGDNSCRCCDDVPVAVWVWPVGITFATVVDTGSGCWLLSTVLKLAAECVALCLNLHLVAALLAPSWDGIEAPSDCTRCIVLEWAGFNWASAWCWTVVVEAGCCQVVTAEEDGCLWSRPWVLCTSWVLPVGDLTLKCSCGVVCGRVLCSFVGCATFTAGGSPERLLSLDITELESSLRFFLHGRFSRITFPFLVICSDTCGIIKDKECFSFTWAKVFASCTEVFCKGLWVCGCTAVVVCVVGVDCCLDEVIAEGPTGDRFSLNSDLMGWTAAEEDTTTLPWGWVVLKVSCKLCHNPKLFRWRLPSMCCAKADSSFVETSHRRQWNGDSWRSSCSTLRPQVTLFLCLWLLTCAFQ